MVMKLQYPLKRLLGLSGTRFQAVPSPIQVPIQVPIPVSLSPGLEQIKADSSSK
jgi:hypothetical protein